MLYDYYQALSYIINHSLEFKHARAKFLKIDTLAFIEKLDTFFFDMIVKLNLLIKSKNEALLNYFLQKPISRQSIYYVVLINIYHQNKWNFENYFSIFLELLEHTTTDANELEILLFLRFLLTRNYDEVVEHPSNNFWINFVILQSSDAHPDKLNQLIACIHSYPKLSNAIPKFVKQFLSYIFIQGGLSTLSRDSIDSYQDVEKYIKFLIKNGMLHKQLARENILNILAAFNGEFSVFCDNHQLFNSRSQLLSIKHHQLLILQLGVYEHLQPEPLAVDVSYSMANVAIELINSNLIPQDEPSANLFWKTVVRIFVLPETANINFLYHYTSLLPIMVEKMLALDDFVSAKNLISKLLSFNQISKKNFLLERRTPLLELEQLFNFLQASDTSKNPSEQLQVWFTQVNDKKNCIKYLTKEFIDNYYATSKSFLLTKLINKLESFQELLPQYFFTKLVWSLQSYVFSIAKLLDTTEEQYEFLEKSFGHDKDVIFELLDQELLEEKTVLIEDAKKKQIQSIVEQSMFKPSQQVILRSQIPDALIELAAKSHAYFNQDGVLVLSGGAICNLKESKPHLGDYDCLIELEADLSLRDKVLDEDLKHLSLEKHNQLIQFIIFLKKANYQNFSIRPDLSLVELSLSEQGKTIAIDVKIEKKLGLNLEQALIRDLAKRDFKLSTLFICLLPGQSEYEIRVFDKAIRSTNKKFISAVGNNPNLFVEDPIRLLRLIKYQFEHQDFQIDSQLSHIYRHTPWVECFQYLLQTSGGRGRLITHLQQLFSRYGFNRVLDELIKQHKIEAIFGINNSQVRETIDLLKQMDESDSYTCRLDLFLFFYIHHAKNTQTYEQFSENCYRKLLLSFPAHHRIYFEYVEHIIYKTPMDGYVAYRPLLKMLAEISKSYEPEILAHKPGF